jgi:hypothetical protein
MCPSLAQSQLYTHAAKTECYSVYQIRSVLYMMHAYILFDIFFDVVYRIFNEIPENTNDSQCSVRSVEC